MKQRAESIADLEKLHEEMSVQTDGAVCRVCAGASCVASGADKIAAALREKLGKTKVRMVDTGCMGPCARGPVVSVEPAGAIFEHVTSDDVPAIIDAINGKTNDREAVSADLKSFFEGQKRIVLRNCGTIDPDRIEDYVGAGGYLALGRLITESTSEQIIDEIKKSGLRGRGGAGFPTWLKWNFTAQAKGDTKYVLCNADEGDPGAFMDRSVLEGDPHSVIEGMAIAALAIGAKQGYVYVRAEYPLAVERLTSAINAAREAGLLGENILGTDFAFDLEIRKGSGAFVCGEETALMHSIEGKRGEPRPRPPFPAQKGLWGKPSLLNNVETYANVPVIFQQGAEWYAANGTPESRGTKVFALAGAVENTGLVEVPIGTPLGELIYDIGGGIKNGREFKAAQIGGPSGGCIPKTDLNVPLDYESLQELGAIMGSGGLIVMDDETCMVDVARFFLEFVQEESCGKCVPCRVGTKRMLEILDRICCGEGRDGDIEKLIDLGEEIRQTALCGLGQTAPNPVLSTIRHFRHEYEQHIRDHHCEAGVCPGLVRAPCQSACPAGVDVPGFVSLIAEERFDEALKLHRNRNPFAAVCARVCFHTCEDHCRRSMLDDSVAIRGVKRFLVDQEKEIQLPEIRADEANAGRKVAIIGAGPAGLSCAYFLARLGYRPTVLEALDRPGGMLVQTIPAYRLPREQLEKEIRMIESMGVTIQTGKRLGRDFTLESLRDDGYEAVFVGIGAPQDTALRVPGADLEGVISAGDFLRAYNVSGNIPAGKNVVVIGGGNAAIDAARTALRLGAEKVTIVYRRTQEQMPAYDEEIDEAIAEGVTIQALTQPVSVEEDGSGKVAGIRCVKTRVGDFDRSGRRRPVETGAEPFVIEADRIIVAVGQSLSQSAGQPADSPGLFGENGPEIASNGFIAVDARTGQSSVPWVFAGGDCADGPLSVVSAIAGGERGAVGIDLLLTGEPHAFWRQDVQTDTAFDPDADPVTTPRIATETTPIERRSSFDEVERAWCKQSALEQARRCLRCDYGKCVAEQVELTKEALHA